MWVSALFIPATEPKFLAKAPDRGAGAIVLDLEASVVPQRKDEARGLIAQAVKTLGGSGLEVLVRINVGWRIAFKDLEAAAIEGVSGILIPDVRDPSLLTAINGYLDELEADTRRSGDPVYIIPIIESAAGLEQAAAIATSPRVLGVGFGVEDFLVDQGGLPDPVLLDHACLRIAVATRAAGRVSMVLPDSLANLNDMDRFRAAAMRARAMGTEASFAVHPRQVQVLNACLSPTEEELEKAHRIVKKADTAEATGSGAFQLDGRMIDLPIVLRARRLIEHAAGLQR